LNSLSGSNYDGCLVKEGLHATPSLYHCPPPSTPRVSRARPDRVDLLWSSLPEPNRLRVVQTLRRLVLQKLLDADGREVGHDHL
jgi:hypothetical protein